ncbi:hypothetical protein MNBD_GAMMA11-2737 [hydrothermal vent metagenome]|uniref:Nucleoside 2-deoxyribosyltransferase like n=1 Tax=hydrothermal vent metagenome TaxID=652676 RepID=A0A3B0X2V6_9ZZZZ
MATIVKPPEKVQWKSLKSVFLAGTIDNGNSTDWQSSLEQSLSDLDVLILNPRRDEWDATWAQPINNPVFKQQVEWELEGLERADYIFIYFAPNSQSPITLLELGLHARKQNIILVCPEGFWRRGNIEVVANRYNIPLYETIEEGRDVLIEQIR